MKFAVLKLNTYVSRFRAFRLFPQPNQDTQSTFAQLIILREKIGHFTEVVLQYTHVTLVTGLFILTVFQFRPVRKMFSTPFDTNHRMSFFIELWMNI